MELDKSFCCTNRFLASALSVRLLGAADFVNLGLRSLSVFRTSVVRQEGEASVPWIRCLLLVGFTGNYVGNLQASIAAMSAMLSSLVRGAKCGSVFPTRAEMPVPFVSRVIRFVDGRFHGGFPFPGCWARPTGPDARPAEGRSPVVRS